MKNHTIFTYKYVNDNDNDISKVLEYKRSYIENDDKLYTVSYKNNIKNDVMYESFNKIYKNKDGVVEQIGISNNKSKWNLINYDNNIIKKYDESYDSYPYYQYYLENNIDNLCKFDKYISI